MPSTPPTQIDAPVPYPYPILQRLLAIFPLIVWSLLTVVAVVWMVGTGIGLLVGNPIGGGDGRFLYLCVLVPLVPFAAAATFRTTWRAYRGQSALWWHGATLFLGLLYLGLLGIVGD